MTEYTDEQVDLAVQGLKNLRAVLNQGINLVNAGIVKADAYLSTIEGNLESLRPAKEQEPSATVQEQAQATAEGMNDDAAEAAEREENLEWLRTWFLNHEGEYESNEQIEKVLRRETTQDDISNDGLRYVVYAYKTLDRLL